MDKMIKVRRTDKPSFERISTKTHRFIIKILTSRVATETEMMKATGCNKLKDLSNMSHYLISLGYPLRTRELKPYRSGQTVGWPRKGGKFLRNHGANRIYYFE